MENKELTYELAYQELESIQERVEKGDIKISELPETIKRAKYLLQFCQEKLRNIEGEINDFPTFAS